MNFDIIKLIRLFYNWNFLNFNKIGNMPRTKKITEEKKSSKKEKVSKKNAPTLKKSRKRESLSVSRKVKPVVIDIIEDEEETAFPDLPPLEQIPDLPEEENLVTEIDQQKKFFRELVSEIKTNNPKQPAEKEASLSEGKNLVLYRRLVWRFLLILIIAAAAIFYFSFTKLTIAISPKGEVISDNLLVKVEKGGEENEEEVETDFREVVKGEIKELTFNEEKVFMSSGEEYIGEEIVGQVTIVNTTAKNQALVATTRLLTQDNKLFRIKEAVNVPAGGEVEVDIYTEKPAPEFAINPTTFTIPGLWVGLQDKIYAKNKEAFIYRQKANKYVKAADIEKAINELQSIILAKAKAETSRASKDTETLYEFLGSTDFDYDVKAGDDLESFTIKASSSLLVVSFSKNDIYNLAGARLGLLIPDDKRLIEDGINFSYKFENYDKEKNEVTLKLDFNGTMILKSNTNFIDKKQLTSLTREQLENYLENFQEIKEYELDFFPDFINRSPKLPERIKIEIKGLEK